MAPPATRSQHRRSCAGSYDGPVGTFGQRLREHVGNFFTNWSESDLPVARKVGLTFKNRAKSLLNKGCCGNRGQPGC